MNTISSGARAGGDGEGGAVYVCARVELENVLAGFCHSMPVRSLELSLSLSPVPSLPPSLAGWMAPSLGGNSICMSRNTARLSTDAGDNSGSHDDDDGDDSVRYIFLCVRSLACGVLDLLCQSVHLARQQCFPMYVLRPHGWEAEKSARTHSFT